MLKHRFNGFTLIELILVIVIVGIMGISTTQFIKSSAEIYITSVKLDEVAGQARFALIRLGKELRSATPNSIRVIEDDNSYQCLEFAPIKTSSVYLNDFPTDNKSTGTKLDVVILSTNIVENDLVTIFPQTADDIFDTSRNRVHPLSSVSDPAPAPDSGNGTQTWSFENDFAINSPSRRLFVLQSSPVSICIESGGLYYYSGSGYNYSAVQPQPSKAHILSNIQGQLLAKHIKNLDVFSINKTALMSNATVTIKLEMELNQSESFVHSNDIYIQNVP